MINKVGIKNFRIFKEYTEFDMAPITVLTGPNNSGKSSFLKLLSLLKYSFTEKNRIEKLNFDGGNHNLGTFEKVLTRNSSSKHLKIDLPLYLDYFDEKFQVELIYGKNDLYDIKKEDGKLVSFKIYNENRVLFWGSDHGINDSIEMNELCAFYSLDINYLKNTIDKNLELNKGPDYKPTKLFFNYYKEKSGKRIILNDKYQKFFEILEEEFYNYYQEFDIALFNNNMDDWMEEIQNFIHKDYLINLFNKDHSIDKNKPTALLLQILNKFNDYFINDNSSYSILDIEEFTNNIDTIKLEVNKNYNEKINQFLFNNIKRGIDKLLLTINSINHLSVNRGSQQRVLTNNSNNEIDAIVKDYFFAQDSNQFIDTNPFKFTNDALNILGIKGELKIVREEGVLSKIYIQNGDVKTTLADLGFGYSQVIPIILKIVSLLSMQEMTNQRGINIYNINDIKKEKRHKKEKNNNQSLYDILKAKNEETDFLDKKTRFPILIIEEPEANLHPNLQSKLADILILAYKNYGIHFILETHSEYLIRKLQYLTAKKEIDLDDVVIYYFNSDQYVSKNEKKVKKITIDQFGGLSDSFGPGFFDEATNLKFELSKLNNSQFN